MAKTPATARPSLKNIEFTPGTVKGAIKATGATSRAVYMVPIDQIKIAPGFNLRVTDSTDYRDEIEVLKQSILEEGFYPTKPLAGFASLDAEGEDIIVVTDGHRRLEAAKLAVADGAEGLEKLPVILKPVNTTSLDLAVALHKENSAKPLSMLENAVLVRRLLTSGLEEKEVASRLGFTERYINDLKVLVGAPKAVRQLVSTGKISGTEAVQQLRKNPEAAAQKLQDLAAKAEKKSGGASAPRLTRKVIENDGEKQSRVKMETIRLSFQMTEGSTAALEDAEPYFGLIPTDWFTPTKRANEIRALHDISFEVTIRRPKREMAASSSNGVDHDPLTGDDDDDDDDGDAGGAPDLRHADIGDPVDNQGL